jgi:hypothetical protein
MAGHDAPAVNETGKQKDREAVKLLNLSRIPAGRRET